MSDAIILIVGASLEMGGYASVFDFVRELNKEVLANKKESGKASS
jgi:hypothetical protein